jgi:riboflavin kinase/FMN adenylyltransferase
MKNARPVYSGVVVKGDGLAGREFDVPTANLDFRPRPRIRHGVYAAKIRYGRRRFNGIVCWGVGRPGKFEVHLFGFRGQLLGKKITVEIHRRLSELVTWQSKERMRQKIQHDIDLARQYFS